VAVLQLDEAAETGFLAPGDDATADLFFAVLKASELKGVLALRIFDAEGNLQDAVPEDFILGGLGEGDLATLQKFRPISRYSAEADMGDYFPLLSSGGEEKVPVLEVLVPLHRSDDLEILGFAQFLLEGENISAEFGSLDKNILTQAGIAFVSGGVIIVGILGWAFRRIKRSQLLLEERSDRLIKANAELTLAAKTSAVGAIASHLIHGLKNPLAGLEAFVSTDQSEESEDRRSAVESTERMRGMIDEVVGVLRDDETGTTYTVTLSELGDLLRSRANRVAVEAGITFNCEVVGEWEFDNRQCNLLLLILINLVNNAIEATPTEGRVAVKIEKTDNQIEIRVYDSGEGVREDVRGNLFHPIRSGKAGGAGIGLAISRQLAGQIDAELSLESTGSDGSCFLLRMAMGGLRRDSRGQSIDGGGRVST
jgi:signal transduction histidine kinase